MSMHICYLLLGSNLGDRKKNIELSKHLINNKLGRITKYSPLEETAPVGFVSQFSFYNQVVVVETELSPMKILEKTQDIENHIGRKNKTQNQDYQDRLIDIDILYYDKIHFLSNKLSIPHQENIKNRKFVKVLICKVPE